MAKAKTKGRAKGRQAKPKQAEGRRHFWRLPRFAWLLIAVAIVGIVVLIRLYPPGQPPSGNSGTPRAAIVDQLSVLQENPAFIAEVTGQLEECGFEVDLYQGDEITVAFYRGLSARGYKVIVFRAHSGILEEDETVHLKTTVFTNELYSAFRYQVDQWEDRLFRATIGEEYDWVFSISPKFIRESMPGRFDDTVIIMMGCAGIYIDDLATAFIDKGASAYLAWDATVLLNYVDSATLHLVDQLFSERRTIREAVDSTMRVIGPDPRYGADLQYYPPGIGGKTLAGLTG
ncbi:MAG: hypothetical protein ACNA7X_02380 [Dehalococcoidia bacterium]